MLLLVLVLCSSLASAALIDGNLIYYSFDTVDVAGNDVYDLSSNGHNGTIGGGGAINGSGIIGESIALNGTTYVDANWFMTNFSTGDPYTLVYWFKATSTGVLQYVVTTNDGHISQITTADKIRSAIYGGAGDTSGTSYADADWHFVVQGSDGSNGFRYVDQTENDTFAKSTFNDGLLAIGRRATDGTNYVSNGNVDELGLWNRTLTNAEIIQLYNSGSGLNPYTTPPPSNVPGITIGNTFPINGSSFAVNEININTTVNSTTDFNCTLNINGSEITNTITYDNPGTNVTNNIINSMSNIIDNDWSTLGYDGLAWFNYSIPSDALREATKYQVKDGAPGVVHNLSIPSSCWNGDILQIQLN